MKDLGKTSFSVTKNFWNDNHDVGSEMEKKNVLFDYEKWRNDFNVVKLKKQFPVNILRNACKAYNFLP